MAILFAAAGLAHGANYYWDTSNTADNGVQDGGGSWQNSSLATLRFLAETTPGVVPTSGTNVKWFNTGLGLQNTVTFGAGGTGGTVNIGSSSGANGPAALGITIGPTTGSAYSFTGASTSGTSTLTLGAGGITMASGAMATTFDATRLAITLSGSGGSTTSLTNNAAATLTIDAPISGTNAIAKSGAGAVSLGGPNTFSGGLTVAEGTLIATNAGALGSGGVTVNAGATLDVRAAITKNISNGGTVSVGPGGNLSAASLGGAVSLVGASGTLATLTSTLASGTLAIGSLSTGGNTNLSLAAGSQIAASGVVDFSGVNNLVTLTGNAVSGGVYTIVQGSSLSGLSGLSLGGGAIGNTTIPLGSSADFGGNTYAFGATSNALQLTVTGTVFNLAWNGGPSGTWDSSTANWQKDGIGGNIQFVTSDNVTIGSAAAIAVPSSLLAGTLSIGNSSGSVDLSGTGGVSASSLAKSNAGSATITTSMQLASGLTVTAGSLTTGAGVTITAGGLSVAGGGYTASGGVTISAGGLTVTSGSATLNAASTIAGGISVSGGTLALNAASAVSGPASLTGGVLSLGASNAIGTGTATLNGGSIVATVGGISLSTPIAVGSSGGMVANDGAFTLAGAIVGGATNTVANVLVKTGSGTLSIAGSLGANKAGVQVNVVDGSLVLAGSGTKEFGGTSTFAGTVSATNQTINMSQNAGFAGPGQILLDGGSINAVYNSSGGNATIANAVGFSSGVAVVASSSKNLAFTGPISGSGTITTSGGGKVSFSGTTEAGFSGSLVVSHTSSGGSTEVSTQALASAASVVVNANANRPASPHLSVANTVQDEFAGVISGAGIVGIASGTTRAILSGTNTYSGGSLLSGDVGIKNASGLGTGPITSQGSGARVWWDGDAASVTIANALSTGTAATSVLAFAPGSGKTIVLSGSLGGAGQLKVSGGGDLDLRQLAANTTTGGIEVGTGRILTSGSNLGSGAINFGTGTASTLVAMADITLTNAFTAGSTSSSGYTANFDTNGRNVVIASSINDKTAGQAKGGNVAKLGAGTLTLSGSSGYTGTTTVMAGTLALAANASIASSSAIAVAAGATLDVTAMTGGYAVPTGQSLGGLGTVAGSVTIGTGATLSPGASPGTLGITQGLTLAADGRYNWQVLDATGTAGGVGGVLTIAATQAKPFTINLASLSAAGPDVSGSAANFIASQNYVWKIASAGGGIAGFSPDKFAIVTSATGGSGGFVNDLAGGAFSVTMQGNEIDLVFQKAAPASLIINVPSGSQTQSQAGSGLLSGTTPFEKTGAGTLVLDQANTLTGVTTVSQGTLQLDNADALASSPVTVAAGATLSVGPQVQAVVPSLVNNGLVDVGLGKLTVVSGLSAESVVAGILAGLTDGTAGITSSGIATAAGGRASAGSTTATAQ